MFKNNSLDDIERMTDIVVINRSVFACVPVKLALKPPKTKRKNIDENTFFVTSIPNNSDFALPSILHYGQANAQK